MAFIVVLDACVLYPAPLRDLLIRLARTGLFRAKWTGLILDECFRSILQQRSDLDAKKLERTRELMQVAVPDCMVEGHESLIAGLALPDPDDRHVLAAGIRAGAQVIVTANLADFPEEALRPWDLEAQHPDEFVLNLIDLSPDLVCNAVRGQLAALRAPTQTLEQLLDTLAKVGLRQSVQQLHGLLSTG